MRYSHKKSLPEYIVTKLICIDITVATKDDVQDLTAEETTKAFIQSNLSFGEELKSKIELLKGKEYYIYVYIRVETKFKIFD